jgi:hypothetical protein
MKTPKKKQGNKVEVVAYRGGSMGTFVMEGA